MNYSTETIKDIAVNVYTYKTRLPILINVVSLILTSVIAIQAPANSSGYTSSRAGFEGVSDIYSAARDK